jgi:plasmid maintenance system antidote protein VapI
MESEALLRDILLMRLHNTIIVDIAKRIGVPRSRIDRIISDNKDFFRYWENIESDDISYLYNEKKMSISEVAFAMNVSSGTIRSLFKKYGIKARSSHDTMALKYGKRALSRRISLPVDDIVYLYTEKKFSVSHIAK